MIQLINNNVSKFCNLVTKIDKLNTYLQDEKKAYDNGTPNRSHMNDDFEKLYEKDLEELYSLQSQFISYLSLIYYENI